MNRLNILAVLAAAMLLASCGDDSGDAGGSLPPPSEEMPSGVEDITTSFVNQLDGIATAVESVTDEDSARKAAQSIAQINKELDLLAEATADMSEMERSMAIMSKAQDLYKVQMRIAQGMQKLTANPELLQIVSDEIQATPDLE